MNILKYQLSVWPAPTPPPSSVEKHPTVSEPVNFRIIRDDIAAPTDRDDLPARLHPTARSETRKTHLEKKVECYFTQDAHEHLPWK